VAALSLLSAGLKVLVVGRHGEGRDVDAVGINFIDADHGRAPDSRAPSRSCRRGSRSRWRPWLGDNAARVAGASASTRTIFLNLGVVIGETASSAYRCEEVSRRLAGAPTPAGQPCKPGTAPFWTSYLPATIIAFDDHGHTWEQACRVYSARGSTRLHCGQR
jgi:hypothetical protein